MSESEGDAAMIRNVSDTIGLLAILGGVAVVVAGMAVATALVSGVAPWMPGFMLSASIAGMPVMGNGVILLLLGGSAMVAIGGFLRR